MTEAGAAGRKIKFGPFEVSKQVKLSRLSIGPISARKSPQY